MPNNSFEFSPRLQLAFDNLPLLREVTRIFQEEGQADLKRLLKYLSERMPAEVSELKGWKKEVFEHGLYFWPGDHWDTEDDDGVAIAVEFKHLRAPQRSDGSPWAGVYVPERWTHRKRFREKVREQVGASLLDRDWSGEPEDAWPLWEWIEMLDFINEDKFSVSLFVSALEDRLRKLVAMRSVIDKVIREVGA